MLLKYARKQRASIYHPATIEDLPFEVLREAFLYLEPEDLVSPSRVNRSWRPAAQDVQRSRLVVDKEDNSLMCGIQFTRIVFGYESFSIKHLKLYLRLDDPGHIPILSRLASSTLQTLHLIFAGARGSASHYATLDQFFSQCHRILNLKLQAIDFGDDPASISRTIKDGFYGLSQLSLIDCKGDLRMFVVSVPIHNLHSFSNKFFGVIGGEEIVSTIATNYPTIKKVYLEDQYSSFVTLLKFAEFCRDIEELSFVDWSGDVELKRSDIEAIASLPRLKSLNIDFEIADNAVSALSRFRGLKHLALCYGSFDLTNILPTIGKPLLSLVYNSSNSIMGTVNVIVEHCPNLQILDLRWIGREDANKAVAVDSLKRGLKQSRILKLNHKSVRLGTDWEGYR
jgi:hypothetical protein